MVIRSRSRSHGPATWEPPVLQVQLAQRALPAEQVEREEQEARGLAPLALPVVRAAQVVSALRAPPAQPVP